MTKAVLLAILLAALLAPGTRGVMASEQQLDASWTSFIEGLQRAQHSLTDPAAFPPPSTDRNLAEGYRYLLGHLGRMIEMEMRQDPRFPEFFRSMDMLRKWTAENPDAMYLKAPIDSTGMYRVAGNIPDHRQWRTSERGAAGPKAPRMVTFQTITDVPGATGGLEEMAACRNQTLDHLNSFGLEVEADGRFELLIGPRRPEHYRGNFLPTRKLMTCPATGETSLRHAQFLSVREIFSDWENEQPIAMEIVRLDAQGDNRPPVTAAFIGKKLEKIGTELPNQIRFWQLLQEFALEIRSDVNGDGRRNQPVNALNQPAPPFTAGGVAGAQQLYAAGIFDFAQDQALVIKVTAPVEPHYIGFQLSNLWFEGPDQQNYVSSLSGHQLPVASDGSRYYIVAHRDPGVAGWVDTTGLPKGSMAMRFIFRNTPQPGKMPTARAQLVTLGELAGLLPADTPTVSITQRKAEIARRQSHIKMRWRGH